MNKFVGFFLASVLAIAVNASAQTTRTVCASGCTTTSFQTALNSSVCGDIVELRANESFVGNFTLPNKGDCSANPIVIQSDADSGDLPSAGVRATKGISAGTADGSTDYRSFFPNIKASSGGLPALSTAEGANGYLIRWLEFEPNPLGFNAIILLGTNTSAQKTRAQQPKNITVDQCILYGDDVYGQKVGIDLNGQNLTVRNSHIDTIFAVGQDAQAIRSINSSGPLTITNNFIEGAAENVLFGGDDPWMMAKATVDAGATTTQATLSNITDRSNIATTIDTLRVGQTVAFLVNGGTGREHGTIQSCGTAEIGAECSSNTITYSTLPVAPDTGASSEARWGEIPDGITFARNHVTKRMSWKTHIIPQPANVQAAAQTGTGSLAAGTYYYRVVAYNINGYNGADTYSPASAEVSATLSATGQINLTWDAVAGAEAYRVYGRVAASPTGYIVALTNSATDSGGALTTGNIPSTTKPVVKTLFELKFGKNVLVSGSIFENNWAGQGDAFGQCMWIKSNSQSGNAEFAETANVVIEKSICRNVNGIFNILATNQSGANRTKYLSNVIIRDFLAYDSDDGVEGPAVDAVRVNGPVQGLTLDHNTIIHKSRGFLYFTSSSDTVNFTATNNIIRNEQYGIFGLSCTAGTGCLNASTVNPVFLSNAMGGVSSSNFPANNFYVSLSVFEGATHFTDYDNDDYSLTVGSSWNDAGTDNEDLGADLVAIAAATEGVASGTPPTAPAVTIATTTLPDGTVGIPYDATVTITGGTAPFTCSTVSGTLPPGLTWSVQHPNCRLSGAPTTQGTYNFTARVTDSAATSETDDQAFSVDIAAAPSTLAITTVTLTDGQVPQRYSKQLEFSGGTPPISWAVTSGDLPENFQLSAEGLLEGIATETGTFNFTVTATDADSGTDDQALSLEILEETFPCQRNRRFGFSSLATFRQPTAPTTCVMLGDFWFNTVNRELSYATQIFPTTTWTPFNLIATPDTGHALLSDTHTDTEAGTPGADELIIGSADGEWTKITLAELATLLGIDEEENNSNNIPVTTTLRADGSDFSTTAASIQGSNVQELGGGGGYNRVQLDLTNATEMRIVVQQTIAATTAIVRLQYSTDFGASWTDSGITATLGSTNLRQIAGSWTAIPIGMRGDVTVRLVITGGNGTESPDIGNAAVSYR